MVKLSFNGNNLYYKKPDNKLTNLGYFSLNDKEYIPLFMINKILNNRLRSPNEFLSIFNILNPIQEYYNISNSTFTQSEKLYRSILYHNICSLNTLNKSNTRGILEYSKEEIHNYINNLDLNLKEHCVNNKLVTYENLFSYIFYNNVFSKINFRLRSYLTNFGFLADTNNTFHPLFSFMVKKENMKYVRLCHLTNNPIDSSVLEFWVDKSLVKDEEYKKMKMSVTKHIKPYLLDSKIKTIEVDNLGKYIFNTIEVPTFKTIKDKKEFEVGVLSEFLEHSRVIHNTKYLNVNLVA